MISNHLNPFKRKQPTCSVDISSIWTDFTCETALVDSFLPFGMSLFTFLGTPGNRHLCKTINIQKFSSK